METLLTGKKVFLAGHRGMVGAALLRKLQTASVQLITRTHSELDLLDQTAVADFYRRESPDVVILAAARVGGIHANNSYPAQFIYENMQMECNVIHQAWLHGVTELLFLGSSCIYPRMAEQPIREESLLTGVLEATNEPYAIAKIAGIKLCEAYNRQYGTHYRSVMPTNLFGPGDNYDLESSHVIPAILRKCHLARLALIGDSDAIRRDQSIHGPLSGDFAAAIGFELRSQTLIHGHTPVVELWGSGRPRREFLHVDEMADASLHLLLQPISLFIPPEPSFINIGTGRDLTILETAELIARTVGYEGEIRFNPDYPDGTPRKLLDVSRLQKTGWRAAMDFSEALEKTYQEYLVSE